MRLLLLTVVIILSTSPGQAQETQVRDTKFSVRRGFYGGPLSLTITSETPGATIIYTVDGSTPTPSNGTTYSEPLAIDTTTVVRAFATAPGLDPTNVDTHTYLFLDDVIDQPTSISGYARNTYSTGGGPSARMDYQMDPTITDDSAYTVDLLAGLQEIPSLCIAVDPGDIFGGNGFYDGTNVEEQVSVETLYFQNPEDNEQSEAGIESHSHLRMKRSLRLNFRAEYGDSKWQTKLFRRAPFNDNNRSTPNEFDRVILRAGNNRAWSRNFSREKTTYAIDEFARQTQAAMGGDGMRGAFVHLYINGLYWGLFNPVHRADTFFTSETYGGAEADWFAVSHGGDIRGNDNRYDYLKGTLKNKDMSVETNYQELQEHLDIDNFIDYLLLHWYTTTGDWPQNNWYGGLRNPSSPDGPTPMKFFAWDGEWSWDLPHSTVRTSVPDDAAPWVHIDFHENDGKNSDRPIANLFNSAKDSPAFIRRLGDRAHKHLANSGALTDANARDRFSTTTDAIKNAIIAESARWGDTVVSSPFTRDDHWQPEIDDILGYIDGRAAQFIAALRAENYYPDFDPPTYNRHGGEVAPNFSIALSNPNTTGTLHLSLDGTDPAGGTTTAYNGPVTITETTRALARVRQGSGWSALAEAIFIIPSSSDLHLTELNYHPTDPTPTEVTAGHTDENDFEYIEFQNTGTVPLDISGYTFTTGITHTFATPTILTPGETAVLVRKTAAFQFRYGTGARIIADYAGKLDNDGERLALVTGLGQTVFDFTYNNIWHPTSDGLGDTLQPGTQPPTDAATDWGPSHLPAGTPGTQEITYQIWATAHGISNSPAGDTDNDSYPDLLEYALGTDPTRPDTPAIEITHTAITYNLRKNRPGVTVTPQLSGDLSIWHPQPTPTATPAGVFQSYQLSPSGAPHMFFRLEVSR